MAGWHEDFEDCPSIEERMSDGADEVLVDPPSEYWIKGYDAFTTGSSVDLENATSHQLSDFESGWEQAFSDSQTVERIEAQLEELPF